MSTSWSPVAGVEDQGPRVAVRFIWATLIQKIDDDAGHGATVGGAGPLVRSRGRRSATGACSR